MQRAAEKKQKGSKSNNALALLLAGMMVAGLGLSSTVIARQQAFAHDFTQDDSANFVATMEKAKVHLSLARSNLGRNAPVAHEHVEHAAMLIGNKTIAEIAEKNKRIANDLPASLEALGEMIHMGSKPKAEIRKEITKVNALLDEAVSARVDRQVLKSGTVQATVMAQMVSESLDAYEAAFGAQTPEAQMHSHSPGASGSGPSSSSGPGSKIVDRAAYDASKAFAAKASSMYGKVNRLAPEGSKSSMDAVLDGLVKLRAAINHKAPVDDVMVIVHGQIHESLVKAFGLKVDG
jgi:hypothetical protein